MVIQESESQLGVVNSFSLALEQFLSLRLLEFQVGLRWQVKRHSRRSEILWALADLYYQELRHLRSQVEPLEQYTRYRYPEVIHLLEQQATTESGPAPLWVDTTSQVSHLIYEPRLNQLVAHYPWEDLDL